MEVLLSGTATMAATAGMAASPAEAATPADQTSVAPPTMKVSLRDGHAITTIEGLGKPTALHPMPASFAVGQRPERPLRDLPPAGRRSGAATRSAP